MKPEFNSCGVLINFVHLYKKDCATGDTTTITEDITLY